MYFYLLFLFSMLCYAPTIYALQCTSSDDHDLFKNKSVEKANESLPYIDLKSNIM